MQIILLLGTVKYPTCEWTCPSWNNYRKLSSSPADGTGKQRATRTAFILQRKQSDCCIFPSRFGVYSLPNHSLSHWNLSACLPTITYSCNERGQCRLPIPQTFPIKKNCRAFGEVMQGRRGGGKVSLPARLPTLEDLVPMYKDQPNKLQEITLQSPNISIMPEMLALHPYLLILTAFRAVVLHVAQLEWTSEILW